jgi:hypothetical protein
MGGSHQVGVDGAPPAVDPVLKRDTRQEMLLEDAGIVHQDVDPAHGRDHVLDHAGNSLRFGHVGPDLHVRAAFQGAQCFFGGRLVPVVMDRDPRTLFCQGSGYSSSDPPGGPGNQSHLSCKIHRVTSP